MAKLNGWKRIGVVASVLWILGAGIYTLNVTSDRDIKFSGVITEGCIEGHGGQDPDGQCSKRGDDYAVQSLQGERIEAALAAFIPVPLGWGFVYLVLFLVRWIKRGFVKV